MATPDSEPVQAFAESRLQQVARLAALQRTYGANFMTAYAMITSVRDCHAAGIDEHRVVAALAKQATDRRVRGAPRAGSRARSGGWDPRA